jgi:hypothetical protein
MWEPQRLTIVWASTACYSDSFTLPVKNEDEDKEENMKSKKFTAKRNWCSVSAQAQEVVTLLGSYMLHVMPYKIVTQI